MYDKFQNKYRILSPHARDRRPCRDVACNVSTVHHTRNIMCTPENVGYRYFLPARDQTPIETLHLETLHLETLHATFLPTMMPTSLPTTPATSSASRETFDIDILQTEILRVQTLHATSVPIITIITPPKTLNLDNLHA